MIGEQMLTRQEIMKNISLAINNSGKTQAEIAKGIGVSRQSMAKCAAAEQCMFYVIFWIYANYCIWTVTKFFV